MGSIACWRSLIIVFREVLEAGLIVGIVLAATESVPRRLVWVSGGIAVGIAGAALVAAFARFLSSMMEGMGQEVFNAQYSGRSITHAWVAQYLDGQPWQRNGAGRNKTRQIRGFRR